MDVKKGQEIELTIQALAYGGKGISRYDNFVIFVDKSIPGQKVLAYIYKKKKDYAEARVKEILAESPYFTNPKCIHFSTCGGCKTQQLSYSEQLNQKKSQVQHIFERQASISDFVIDSIVPANPVYNYRNKMEFTFSSNRWILENEPANVKSDFALGMHIPRRWDKILDIESCHLMPEIGTEIINYVRDLAKKLKLKPYDQKSHIGFLRY